MASTRNNNTPGNYCIQQRGYSLALKYDLEIIPIYLERRENNFFKMEIQQPIKYKKTQNSNEDKKNITVEINKIIEKMILKYFYMEMRIF